jgi:hypothetical protein
VLSDRVLATIDLIPERVALTPEQVTEYDLPTAPAKTTDPRTGAWGGRGTLPAGGLPPDVLAVVVRAAIESWMDMGMYDAQLALEERDRAELLQLPPGRAG